MINCFDVEVMAMSQPTVPIGNKYDTKVFDAVLILNS